MGGVTGRPSTDMIVELPEMWWAEFGACRGMYASLSFWAPTSELHYQKAEQPAAKRRREAACKAVCAGCPVRDECLSWGLAHDELGVWGGTTDDDRQAMRRAARRIAEPLTSAWLAAQAIDRGEVASDRSMPRIG